jgi:hypothetical protein
VVGWMTVPLAERSTANCCGGFLVAAPAQTPDTESTAMAAAVTAKQRTTGDMGSSLSAQVEALQCSRV